MTEVLTAMPEGPVKELYTGGITGPDPYPIYRRLRAQGIVTTAFGDSGSPPGEVHVARYDDVLAVLRHPGVSSDARNSSAYGLLDRASQRLMNSRSFAHTDPPDHTRLRRLVAKAFTRRRVEALRPMIESRVNEAVDRAAADGRMDIVDELAYPLPVQVICELLGVPVEDHLDLGRRQQLCCFDPSTVAATPTFAVRLAKDRDADLDYWHDVVGRRRGRPGDDLLSALIAAREDGDRLSDDELVNTVRLLFIGGHETTVSLISNGMLALLRHPHQLALLRGTPGLATAAVEETIRFDAPFQFVRRTARDDLDINGTTIPAGAQMMVWLAAANRDPGAFDSPDVYDITRRDNHHLGFGSGIHACLGGPLARLQGGITLRTLARRLAQVRLGGDPIYHDDAVHAIKSLPVTFTVPRAS